MKTKYALRLAIPCLILLALVTSSFAAQDTLKIFVDGVQLPTSPVIVEGRTLVPVRDLSEALNATVEWDNENKGITITKLLVRVDQESGLVYTENRIIRLWIGSKEATVDGNAVSLDVPPQMIDGKTMLPARAVCTWLEADVEWDNANRSVLVIVGSCAGIFYDEVDDIQIAIAERAAMDKALNANQDEVKKAIQEMNSWISEWQLRDKGVSFSYEKIAGIPQSKNEIGFYRGGTLTGMGGYLVYAVPDFDESSLNDVPQIFNGVTIQKRDNTLYFKIAELQNLNIIK